MNKSNECQIKGPNNKCYQPLPPGLGEKIEHPSSSFPALRNQDKELEEPVQI